MASAINGARSPSCFRISAEYSAPPSRSPSSSAPISLPRTRKGAMQRNHTLEILPVELRKVSQRSRQIFCGPPPPPPPPPPSPPPPPPAPPPPTPPPPPPPPP